MKKKKLNLMWLVITFLLITLNLSSANIIVNKNVSVNSNTCDKITWLDSSGLTRTASIVQINGNPAGYKGGYFTQITFKDGSDVICNESNTYGDLSGLGFMIDHVIYQKTGYTGRGWINSKQDGVGGSTQILFEGTNHIIYQTEMQEYGDDGDHNKGTCNVKWIYMVRTGNDYIVESIAYDFSSTSYGVWGNDIRSPYCELNWTGTGASNTLTESIDGIEYCATDSNGVSYIFKTRSSSPFSDGYTFNTPGRNIPYTLMWKNSPDREIGYVSTLDLIQQAAGGGFLSAPVNIGSQSSTMPPNWGINYQFNGFQNWYGDKMTWQFPYGACGGESSQDGTVHQPDFPDWTWRKRWPAYPTIGYTLLIQYGKHTQDNVRKLMNEIADIHSLTNPLTANTGTIPTTGKTNLYSSSNDFTLKPAGYNHLYHLWEVNCASNNADVTLTLGSVNLKNQTFMFNNYNLTDMPVVKVNNVVQTEGVDIFSSLDTVNKKLYITFNKTFTGTNNIVITGGSMSTPTPTPTSIGSDCLYYHIDRSNVPSMVFMKKLTLKINVGNCSGVNVYVDGQPVPSTYNPTTKECMFTTDGSDVVISRTGYTGGATNAVTKATLYNDKKWAYSFTFDDGRPSVNTIALPMFEAKGFRGGVALNTKDMQEAVDGYVMSWQSADNLRAHGWSFFDHNYSHQAARCSNISTETVPVKQAIEARWPGYLCTHFVYPYVDITEWTCIRDSGLFLSAENYNGINYADVKPSNPFILNRYGFFPAGSLNTAALANAAADSAAGDTRARWLIVFTHNVDPGNTGPSTQYDTNEATLSSHINYVYNTYGAGGLNNMWFAPTDEVMQYILTREYTNITFTGSGVCGPLQTPTFTNTIQPGATNTFTATPTNTPLYSECKMDDLEDVNNQNLFGGYWYTYTSGDPAHPNETTIWPASGQVCTPSAGGANSSSYAMRITGTVGAINVPYYPCIGIGSQLNSNAGAPTYQETNISGCVGLKFYVKGDGKSYFVKIPYTNSSGQTLTGYDDYRFTFTAPSNWTLISVPFSSMTQGGWGTTVSLITVLQHAKEIQWQTNFNGSAGSPATADLWIDDISIYGCSVCPNSSTAVPTSTLTNTPTNTQTFTSTQTNTATRTNTFTDTQTPTRTLTFTATNTSTFTMTFTNTSTSTNTFTITNTPTDTATATITLTPSDTATFTATPTGTWYTDTPTNTGTNTMTSTPTNTATNTLTNTAIDTPTNTYTNTLTHTETNTPTNTHTNILTNTATNTPTNTQTATFTVTNTITFTASNTRTLTPTFTKTSTITNTFTQTYTTTIVPTSTFTPTPVAIEIETKFEFDTGVKINLYPNPVIKNTDIKIKYKVKGSEEQVVIRIYTSAFRLVKEILFNKSKIVKYSDGFSEIVINKNLIDEFSKGVYAYIIIAKNKDGVEIKSRIGKIVIMK